MNRLIDGRMMEEVAMDVVSEDLSNEDAEDNVPNNLSQAGQNGIESVGWSSSGELIKSNYAQLQRR